MIFRFNLCGSKTMLMKFILFFYIAPFVLVMLGEFFGVMKARYAFTFGLLWLVGTFTLSFWLISTDYIVYAFLAYVFSFFAPWVGTCIAGLISPVVPFAETPAGIVKQAYDDLPEEDKTKIRRVGRFGLKLAMGYATGHLHRKGFHLAAGVLKQARRAI